MTKKSLGRRLVLLNHSSQSRWETHVVYRNVTANNTGSYWIQVGKRQVWVQRLYTDTSRSGITGKMRLSNKFFTSERV